MSDNNASPARTPVWARRGCPRVEYRLYFQTGGKFITEAFEDIREHFRPGDTLVVDRVGEFDADLTDAAYAQLGVNPYPYAQLGGSSPTRKGPSAPRFNRS